MAVAEVVEEAEDIQMGMMTIQVNILVDFLKDETTLHPIPAGMIIQGLDDAV